MGWMAIVCVRDGEFRTSAADRSRSFRAPMTARIGSRTFWFFLMVLGERPSSPLASQSSAACRTVEMGVAGLGGDALVELEVHVAELVHNGGLGLAAGLPPEASAVAGIAQGDLAAPQARAVPAAFRVAARAPVLEGDAVLAAPAPASSHGDSRPRGGGISGDDGQPRLGTCSLKRGDESVDSVIIIDMIFIIYQDCCAAHSRARDSAFAFAV
jgi:hypothetical protein